MAPRADTVASIGERELIRRLARIVGPAPRGVLGIGDDAAVTPARTGATLHTVDAQVEGTHFLRALTTPEELGWKALAVNVSDAAGMGGRPEHALVSLVLPGSTAADAVLRLYRGMRRMAMASGAFLVGGNVAAGSALSITISLSGALFGEKPVRRDGARPGDRIFVTGRPGLSDLGRRVLTALLPKHAPDLWTAGAPSPRWRDGASGRHLLSARARRTPAALVRTTLARAATGRFLLPAPRVDAARELLRFGPTALIDTSDGLARDLSHLVNGRGAPVVHADALPVDGAYERLAASVGRDGIGVALQGGEDYELLFTLPAAAAAKLRNRGALGGVVVHEIGVFEGGAKRVGVADQRGVTPLREETDWHFPG